MISSLVNDQLISKRNDQNGKRIYLVSLTQAGTQLLEESLKQHGLWIEKITQNLSDEDITTFKRILQQIHDNVTKKESKIEDN